MATRSTDAKPTIRIMTGSDGVEYKVTIMARIISIRPLRARAADAVVFLPITSIYQRGLLSRAEAEKPKPKRKKFVKRGLLSL